MRKGSEYKIKRNEIDLRNRNKNEYSKDNYEESGENDE